MVTKEKALDLYLNQQPTVSESGLKTVVSSDGEPITAEAVQSIIDYIEEGEPDLKVVTGELGELILRSTGEYFTHFG